MAYSDLVLSDKPYAYYRLNETNGSIAHDSSGNGFDASVSGTVTWGSPAIAPLLSASALFDGVTGVIPLPSTLLANVATGDISIDGWMLMGANQTGSGGILEFDDNTSYYDIECSVSQVRYEVHRSWNAGDAYQVFYTPPNGVANQIYHVAMTFSATTGDVYCYLNGQLVESGAIPAGPLQGPSEGFIGKWDNYFQGQLSDIALYRAVLSPTQITNHYLGGYSLIATLSLQSQLLPAALAGVPSLTPPSLQTQTTLSTPLALTAALIH